MAIRELQAKVWDSFRGGRYTRSNIAKISDDHLLVAAQLIFPGDGVMHKRPGYTLVKNVGFNVQKIFDFRRHVDAQQMVVLAGSGQIGILGADGIAAYRQIVAGEDPAARWTFATNVFGLYGSNGINAYRFVDVAGVLTKYKWGIVAPAAAPTVALIAGGLTLTYGRQYAYSWVSKWTDAQGVTRVHVGPPSPLSAHTGAFTNQVVTVGNLAASVDAQVTHLWIWATNDTPANSTSVLTFLAEVANGTASYGDALLDSALDITRLIPYNNTPPPAARIIFEYQGRMVLAGIPGKPDLVQATGLEEVSLGIPQETAPTSVFFNVPGGTKAITAGCEFNQGAMLATELGWTRATGFSAETFTQRDFIIKPGCAGSKLLCTTPQWMAWVGPDKKIWAWNGYGDPVEISWKIARADGSNQLSMESIAEDQLSQGELRWYSFGRYNILMLLVATQPQLGYFDWCQLWDISILTGPSGPMGELTKDGRLLGAAESDAFFSHRMLTSGDVLVGSKAYIWLADNAGNLFRWPDGWTDADVQFSPVGGSEFSDCDLPEFQKHFRFMDVRTSNPAAKDKFHASALATDGVDVEAISYALPIGVMPASPVDPTCFRAKMELPGVSTGRFVRWFIEFPVDDQPQKVFNAAVKWNPVAASAQ